MPNESITTANLALAINEGFTEGGDLILRSTDGIKFNDHSLFLSVASPVFSDLLQTENKNAVVPFSERAEVLALVLKFIYPRPTPIISSMELLHDAIRVANKCQLDSMIHRLREQFLLLDSPVSVYSNPLHFLSVASMYAFTAEAEFAAKITSKHDFGKIDDLKKLIEAAPATATLVKLVGIPAVKGRVLTEVLFHFERSPMSITSFLDSLTCLACREPYKSYRRQSPPEWQARWARWIFEEIKNRLLVEWETYFDHSNFNRWYYQPNLSLPTTFIIYRSGQTTVTCDCASRVSSSPENFQTWANGVLEHLKSKLFFI